MQRTRLSRLDLLIRADFVGSRIGAPQRRICRCKDISMVLFSVKQCTRSGDAYLAQIGATGKQSTAKSQLSSIIHTSNSQMNISGNVSKRASSLEPEVCTVLSP